jgi:FtsP/CotA-like multicopper oxidase with cupredoxin domain
MFAITTKKASSMKPLLPAACLALALLGAPAARAAAPGITGPSFRLTAQPAYISQPDGQAVYSWGYGCNGLPAGFAPAAITTASCNSMQVPGPTLIVTEGDVVSVTLLNRLPNAAGNTSILFPGFNVCAGTLDTTTGACTGPLTGVTGLLTQEAQPGSTVTYTFVASTPGTHAYYSGTQGDLQVEMGLYGAIIVLPANVPSECTTGLAAANLAVEGNWGESDFRLQNNSGVAGAAYDHPRTCYDREYLFQFSEMDPNIHNQALAQVKARPANCTPGRCRTIWMRTTPSSIPTSPTTATRTCTQGN